MVETAQTKLHDKMILGILADEYMAQFDIVGFYKSLTTVHAPLLQHLKNTQHGFATLDSKIIWFQYNIPE